MIIYSIKDTDEILCDDCSKLTKGGWKVNRSFYCKNCHKARMSKEGTIREVIMGDSE